MLFIEELQPNLNSQSNSILVCNTCLFMYITNTLEICPGSILLAKFASKLFSQK